MRRITGMRLAWGATLAWFRISIDEGYDAFGPEDIVRKLREGSGERLVLTDHPQDEDDQRRHAEPQDPATAEAEGGADGDQRLAHIHRMAYDGIRATGHERRIRP